MNSNAIIDFSILYNRHKKGLYNYVLVITKSKMITEDIVHNVFMRLYDKFETINEQEKIDRWLFSTARNEAMGYFRKMKIRGEDPIENSASTPDASNPAREFESLEIRDIIEKELAEMEPGQSEVFRLKAISDMSYRDIAEILTISEDLVKSRLFKARQKLKIALKHLV